MFKRTDIRQKVEPLAAQNVFIGTSSWKYPGWCGQIYEEQRYLTRNKFSEKKFNESCLAVSPCLEVHPRKKSTR